MPRQVARWGLPQTRGHLVLPALMVQGGPARGPLEDGGSPAFLGLSSLCGHSASAGLHLPTWLFAHGELGSAHLRGQGGRSGVRPKPQGHFRGGKGSEKASLSLRGRVPRGCAGASRAPRLEPGTRLGERPRDGSPPTLFCLELSGRAGRGEACACAQGGIGAWNQCSPSIILAGIC